jgi:hypothetical protein
MVALLVIAMAVAACAQGPNRGTTEITINGKALSINYGRPMLKGRDMLGRAATGTIWRLGSNRTTEITSAADLDIAGTALKAGSYSLWTKKTDDGWILLFHPQLGRNGMPVQTEGFVAQMPLTQTTAGNSVEQLTITLSNDGGKAQIKIEWGTAVLTGSFGVK